MEPRRGGRRSRTKPESFRTGGDGHFNDKAPLKMAGEMLTLTAANDANGGLPVWIHRHHLDSRALLLLAARHQSRSSAADRKRKEVKEKARRWRC